MFVLVLEGRVLSLRAALLPEDCFVKFLLECWALLLAKVVDMIVLSST